MSDEEPTPPEPEGEPERAPHVKRLSMVDEANQAAARIEKATAEMEAVTKRMEAAKVESMLGGQADVATPPAQETPEEYAEKALKGDIGDKKA